jgi:hypothetical protein
MYQNRRTKWKKQNPGLDANTAPPDMPSSNMFNAMTLLGLAGATAPISGKHNEQCVTANYKWITGIMHTTDSMTIPTTTSPNNNCTNATPNFMYSPGQPPPPFNFALYSALAQHMHNIQLQRQMHEQMTVSEELTESTDTEDGEKEDKMNVD